MPWNYSAYVKLPESLATDILNWGETNLSLKCLHHLGIEQKPHVTIIHGMKPIDPQKVRYLVAHETPLTLCLQDIDVFEDNLDFDVLMVGVEGNRLHHLNAMMKTKFDHRPGYSNYSPHVTIAYIRKGSGTRFRGDRTFQGNHFTSPYITFARKNGSGESHLALRGRTR